MGSRGIIAPVGAILFVAAAGFAWWSRTAPVDVEPPHPLESAGYETRPLNSAHHEGEVGRPAAPRPDDKSAVDPPTPSAPSNAAQSAEQREHFRAESDALVRLLFEDIGEDLHLDAAATESLIALLIDQRIRFAETSFGDSVAGVAARQELSAQHRREIEAQIGAARAASFASYEHSIHARFEVQELRRMLERESLPLTEIQRKALIRGAIERSAYINGPVYSGAESELALLQEMQAKAELSNQRFTEVARGVLRPNQFERYEAWSTMRLEAGDEYIRSQEAAQRAR